MVKIHMLYDTTMVVRDRNRFTRATTTAVKKCQVIAKLPSNIVVRATWWWLRCGTRQALRIRRREVVRKNNDITVVSTVEPKRKKTIDDDRSTDKIIRTDLVIVVVVVGASKNREAEAAEPYKNDFPPRGRGGDDNGRRLVCRYIHCAQLVNFF